MSNKMQAAFMVAPMAIALRAQGVPVKIVYLGHRYGSAVVVRKDVIEHRPEAVQMLVDGIARSGLWLEDGTRRQAHRVHAADFVGRYYYRQNPALLRWALTKPIHRVMYEPLSPRRGDFELIV